LKHSFYCWDLFVMLVFVEIALINSLKAFMKLLFQVTQ